MPDVAMPPWLNPILIGAGAIAGGVPTPTSGSGSSSSSTSGTTNFSGTSSSDIQSLLNTLSQLQSQQQSTSTSTPTMSPEATAFMRNLVGKYSNLTNVNLAPYQAQQAEAINRSSNLQSQAVNNIMASRGLATSPVSGTAQAGIEAQRFSSQTNLAQQIPLLQRQLQLQGLQGATSLFSALPRGSSTTTSASGTQTGNTSQVGSTNTTGTNSGYTNTFGNTNSNYNNQTQTGGGVGGLFGGLGAILAGLFP